MATPVPKISDRELKTLLHSSEDPGFQLAVLVVTPVIAIGSLIAINTFVPIVFAILTFGASIWLTLQVARAYLMANAVKVSDKNFPEIQQVLQDTREVLNYHKKVDIYIVGEGTINAFLANFFATKFIVLHSELVEGMTEKNTLPQIRWVVARFVGALRAKHDKLLFFRVLISSLESIKVFNVFLLPYERAVQYSGDQIGLAVCQNLEQALLVLQKLMIGNKLAGDVSREGLLEQKKSLKFSATFVGWFSTHPHTIDRYVNLLKFAERKYPALYKEAVDASQNSR